MENDKVLIDKDNTFCIDDLENKSIDSLVSLETDLRKKLQYLGDDCNMGEEVRLESSFQIDKFKDGSGERDMSIEMHNFDVSNSSNRAVHIDSNEGNSVVFAEDIKVQFFVPSPVKRTPNKDISQPRGLEIQIENDKSGPQLESDKELIKALRSLGKRLQIKCNNLEKDNKLKVSKIDSMAKTIDNLKEVNNKDPDPEKQRLVQELETRNIRNKQLCLLGRQLQEKARVLENDIKSKDESINFLTEQVEFYIDKDSKVSKTINSINANLDKLLNEKQTLKGEISVKDALNISLSSLTNKLKEKCNNLEDDLKTKDSCVVELNDKMKSLQEELDQKKDEEIEYAESFEIELEKAKNKYNAEIKDLGNKNALNLAKLEELKIENEGLLSKLDVQINECKASNLSKSKLETELSQMNTQLKRKDVEIRVLNATSKNESELRKMTEGRYQSSLLTNLELKKCNDAYKARLNKLLIVGRKLKERLDRTVTKARENKMRDMSYRILVLNTKVTDLEDEVKSLKAELEATNVYNVDSVMKTKLYKLRIVGRYFRHKYFQLLKELNENKCLEITYSFSNPLDISCIEESSKIDNIDLQSSNEVPSNIEQRNVLELSNVEPSNVEPCNVESCNVVPSNVESSNVESSNDEPSNVEPSNVEPNNVEPSNVEPRNVESCNEEISNLVPSNDESNNIESTISKSTDDESTYNEPTKVHYTCDESESVKLFRNVDRFSLNIPLDLDCIKESDLVGDAKKYHFANPLDLGILKKIDQNGKDSLNFTFSNPQILHHIGKSKIFCKTIRFNFCQPLIIKNIANNMSNGVNSQVASISDVRESDLTVNIDKTKKSLFPSPYRILGNVIHLSSDDERDMTHNPNIDKDVRVEHSEQSGNENLLSAIFNFESPARLPLGDKYMSSDIDTLALFNEDKPDDREGMPGGDHRSSLKRAISEDHPAITKKSQKVLTDENDSGFVDYQD